MKQCIGVAGKEYDKVLHVFRNLNTLVNDVTKIYAFVKIEATEFNRSIFKITYQRVVSFINLEISKERSLLANPSSLIHHFVAG